MRQTDLMLWNGPKVIRNRNPKPGLHLWTVEKNGAMMRAELRPRLAPHGEGGYCEAQILRDGELHSAKLHPSDRLAEAWASEIRRWLLDAGCTPTAAPASRNSVE